MSRLTSLRRKKKTDTDKIEEPKFLSYKAGGEGFIAWCNRYVKIPVYEEGLPVWRELSKLSSVINPDTGRCSSDMWLAQQRIARECLRMKNGKFVYRLVAFCWMRGEGKSLLVCLIQLWKFFNFDRQKIMLGANSRPPTTARLVIDPAQFPVKFPCAKGLKIPHCSESPSLSKTIHPEESSKSSNNTFKF